MNPLESRTLAMKHPTLKVPPERWPLHGYSVCAVTQIMRKKHNQIGLTYADWYDRLDWNCFCWCLMKHACLDTVCHDLYTSSTQNNDYLQKKESLHHFQFFFLRWIRRDCRYVPCRSLELQKAAQLGFIIHFCTWKPTCDLNGIHICLHYFFYNSIVVSLNDFSSGNSITLRDLAGWIGSVAGRGESKDAAESSKDAGFRRCLRWCVGLVLCEVDI